MRIFDVVSVSLQIETLLHLIVFSGFMNLLSALQYVLESRARESDSCMFNSVLLDSAFPLGHLHLFPRYYNILVFFEFTSCTLFVDIQYS